METIKLSVIKSIQKGTIVYSGFLKLEEAKLLTFTDDYPPREGRIGYQRPPQQKRIKDFANYVNNNQSGYITPILLNSRSKITFMSNSNNHFGIIELPAEPCLSLVDGQHRTLGVIHLNDASVEIPFMLLDNLGTSIEQELFITINREQKKVPMSHVKFIDRDSAPTTKIAVLLEQDENSPWFKKVNLVGLRGTNRPVSLDSLSSALKELLQSGEIKAMDIEDQYLIARDYWDVVSSVWHEAWEAPKTKSLLRKSMGTLAISKLGGYIIPQCLDRENNKLDREKLFELLSRAKHLNWANDGDFRGFSGRQGADLVKNELDSAIFDTGRTQV